MNILNRGMTHIPGGMEQGDVRFPHATQRAHNLKLINSLFWSFPFNIFRLCLIGVTDTTESETIAKRELL